MNKTLLLDSTLANLMKKKEQYDNYLSPRKALRNSHFQDDSYNLFDFSLS